MDWRKIRHFRREEFGYSGDVEPDPTLVQLLDDARAMAAIPFTISSGIRSEERNREVGGVETSAHLTGKAVDIAAESSRERFLIIDALLQCGANRLGVGSDFVHVDTDESKAQEMFWIY